MINLNIIKCASVANAVIGDIIDYKLIVENNEVIDLNKVFIYDVLSPLLEFIEGSIKVNGNELASGNIVSGIDLGTLAPDEKKEVTFRAKAIGQGIIENEAAANFYYTLVPCGKEQYGVSVSNPNVVEVTNVSLRISKEVSKKFVVIGEKVEYTINITNDGELDVVNVFLKDVISNNLELINGSVTIDGVVVNNADLSKGINIGCIKVDETATIKYSVIVKNGTCNGKITNMATATYHYILEDGCLGKGIVSTKEKDIAVVEVGINNFKQLSIEEKLVIPSVKPDMEDISSIEGTIEILKSHIIETPVLISNEGQKLTGYKLIIYGKLSEVVEYTALDTEQTVHSAHYCIPFTTFIVLPDNYCVGSPLEINGVVEHVYFNKLNPREIFSNATILIKAILCNC